MRDMFYYIEFLYMDFGYFFVVWDSGLDLFWLENLLVVVIVLVGVWDGIVYYFMGYLNCLIFILKEF